jgi:flagellar hook-basal body complex protein FliE
MDVKASLASQLYSQAQLAARPLPQQADGAGVRSAGAAFQAASTDFMETLRASEETVKAGLAGRADPQAVVEALAATELAVQTAVAVRDKVVEAYQEILRMPV